MAEYIAFSSNPATSRLLLRIRAGLAVNSARQQYGATAKWTMDFKIVMEDATSSSLSNRGGRKAHDFAYSI